MTANVWDIVRYFRHYRVMAFWSLLGAIAFELIISLAKDRKSKCCYQVNWLRIFAQHDHIAIDHRGATRQSYF